jgi:hypothetical protein
MILPSKLFSYNQSILPQMLLISKTLKTGDQGVKDLFENLQGQFDGVDEFLEALDCLYALGRVELMQDRRTLHYVKRD